MSSLLADKATLRQAMRAARRDIAQADRRAASDAACRRLLAVLAQHRVDAVRAPIAVFLAKDEEINIDAAIQKLLDDGWHVVVPRAAVGAPAPYWPLCDLGPSLHSGAFGVREPIAVDENEALTPADIGIFIVPGLAFDAAGNRLGYGRGWYDQALAPHALVIGVCFDCQIVAHVPVEPHDKPVTLVVTESRTLTP